MIPPMINAMTIGGMPATQRFSGSGAFPVNWKILFCQPRPITLQRMMMTAVSIPISLTSPVAFLANSFFSDIFNQHIVLVDADLTLLVALEVNHPNQTWNTTVSWTGSTWISKHLASRNLSSCKLQISRPQRTRTIKREGFSQRA